MKERFVSMEHAALAETWFVLKFKKQYPDLLQHKALQRTMLSTKWKSNLSLRQEKLKPSACVNLLEPTFDTKEEEDQAGCLLCQSSKQTLYKNC